MLTKRQRDLQIFLEAYSDTFGLMPTYDEMREAIGLASKSGVHRLLIGMEERGFIRRLPSRARAIELKIRITKPTKGD